VVKILQRDACFFVSFLDLKDAKRYDFHAQSAVLRASSRARVERLDGSNPFNLEKNHLHRLSRGINVDPKGLEADLGG
jgi:hypothetical protein